MSNFEGPYRVPPILGSDHRIYIEGPGDGFGYHAGTLWPDLRWDDNENAERGAIVANIAYKEGFKAALKQVRVAIGIEK